MHRPLPLERLEGLAGEEGLSGPDARARRERYGPNDVVEVPEGALRALARETAADPMLWFLAGTSALYLLLGQAAEAGVLLVSLVPLAGMDAWLHRRTRASTAGLRSLLATSARVVRDGGELRVPAADVVPGDLARVAAGEPFPADGVLLAVQDVQVDESALTGESLPVRKAPLALSGSRASRPVAGVHWGLAGTRVLTGEALLRVAYTGAETLYGEIVRSAVLGAGRRTPLQLAVGRLVRWLLAAALVFCAVLALVRLVQGHGWVDAVVSAATLAVAALPEEFPVLLTVFLGVGVHRLARRQALVRRAATVENVGRVTAICSDKTGTLTAGRLHLGHLLPAAEGSDHRLLELAALAAREEAGDPLDEALLAARGAAPRPRVRATFPFTEDRKRETAVVEQEGGLLAATKGSPEVVLALCALPDDERARWLARVEALAAEAHRVLACASRTLERWSGEEPAEGLRFEGLLAFEDPIAPGVVDAVRECREAGIRTIVVTGDHPATAAAVARDLGLGPPGGEPRVVLGDDLEELLRPGAAGEGALATLDVVARAVPGQKLVLVRALQAAGEIVAVTGDGVNDVPALQAADVGIAMGGRGTRAARESASIVLLQDDFGTIVRAIAEGRQLLRNLQLGFQYLLTIHVPLVLTAAAIPLAGYPLLYLPVHVVWIELVIHPTAMLVFQELPPRGRLAPVDRRGAGALLARADVVRVLASGLLLTLLVGFAYLASLDGSELRVGHARAMAMAALSCASALLVAALTRLRTALSRWIAGGTLALALLLIQVPALAAALHLDPLHLDDWLRALFGAALAVAPLLPERGSRRR